MPIPVRRDAVKKPLGGVSHESDELTVAGQRTPSNAGVPELPFAWDFDVIFGQFVCTHGCRDGSPLLYSIERLSDPTPPKFRTLCPVLETSSLFPGIER